MQEVICRYLVLAIFWQHAFLWKFIDLGHFNPIESIIVAKISNLTLFYPCRKSLFPCLLLFFTSMENVKIEFLKCFREAIFSNFLTHQQLLWYKNSKAKRNWKMMFVCLIGHLLVKYLKWQKADPIRQFYAKVINFLLKI